MWKRPGRTGQWWDNLLSGKMSEEEWKKNLRMPKNDFDVLVNLIRPFYKEKSSKIRNDVICLEKRVAMTLYYLKDQGSMTMTANTFGVARCTVGKVLHEICKIITENVGPQLIKFPITKEEVETATSQFSNRFGFPQAIGCIDGTHIPIKQPSENAHDYMSYKQFFSINCQAICNALGQFTNVEIKWPGSVHDARVFANSEIQKGFSEKRFKLFYKELLPGSEGIPQVLIGDPAYPLLPNVMKEYTNCSSNEQVIFNQMLRSARNQIECAFGRLKARWRILLRPVDIPIDKVPNVVFACFVLHNFCERQNIDVDGQLVEEIISKERVQTDQRIDKIHSYTTALGKKVRNTITDYFKEYL